MNRHWTSILSAAAIASGALIVGGALSGCQYFMIASVLMRGPDKIPAVYDLPDRRTLVMVDDPDNALNNPSLEGVIVANVQFHINQNIGPDSEAKKDIRFTGGFVPQRDLATLSGRLGNNYGLTAIDKIGREVGADQVIYVRVVSFNIPLAMGYEHPRAVCRVKVIDAQSGRRLYPAPDLVGDTGNHRGHEVDTQIKEKTYDTSQSGIQRIIRRDLAQQAGRDIARMFYQWTEPEIGSRLPG